MQTEERLTYLVGHCAENEGQNPFGQDHVWDYIEDLTRDDLESLLFLAIWRLKNG